MSNFPLEPEFAELRGRVGELEDRLKSVEERVGLASAPAVASLPTAPQFSAPVTPVASPLPSPSSTDLPSTWVSAPSETAPTFNSALSPVTVAGPSQAQAMPPLFPSGAPEPRNEGPSKSLLDWENLIGGRLALWVGALCVFLALASLLVYVGQTLKPPTPEMRVAAGFAASFALLAGAFAARAHTQRWYSDGLLGASLAVGFLSVWGGGPHFALWSLPVSLAGFSLYSVLGVALSYRRDSQALLALSAIGGYLTPILVHSNNSQNLAPIFLSYLLVLNAGVVAVCVAKRWREFIYGAFGATAFMLALWGWSPEVHIETMRPMLWTFLTLEWGLFAGAAWFRSLVWREESEDRDIALLFCATGAYALVSQWLLAPLLQNFPGAFSLGLMLVFGALYGIARRRVAGNDLLRNSFLALACVAGALFVPLQFGQTGLVWGWMAQGVALLFVARKSNHNLLRDGGRCLWMLAMLALVVEFSLRALMGGAVFDASSLHLLFCLAATALLLFQVDAQDEQWRMVYSLVVAWGGVYWIGRALWLVVPQQSFILPAHRLEATLFVGAIATLLWAMGMWRLGVWRNHRALRWSAWAMAGCCLCLIAALGLWGQAPLVGLRMAAFVVGGVSLAVLGCWHARTEASDASATHEITAVAVTAWMALGATVEIVALGHGGTFFVPSMGATVWFGLCAAWSLFAAGAGAVSVARTWPRLWALAEALFAVALGTLLLESLLVASVLTPIWNARCGAFAATWVVALLAHQVDGDSRTRRGDWWLWAVLLLPLWLSTQELWNGFDTYHAAFGGDWQRFASLGVSLWWSLFATLCLVVGVARRAQSLRIAALTLGALAVCKVFLLDLAFLDSGLRVLSLGGLGVALLFISWLYSRFGRIEKNATA